MKLGGCVSNPAGNLIRVVSSVRVKREALRAMKTLQLGAILAVASVLAHPVGVRAIGIGNAYVEVGDAGNSLNAPQIITGGT